MKRGEKRNEGNGEGKRSKRRRKEKGERRESGIWMGLIIASTF